MSLTLVPCNTRCLNMGDVAMLQVAVRRLRAMWPDETLAVFTSDEAALRRHCPDVEPVWLPDEPAWTKDRYLAGRLHEWMPRALSALLLRGQAALARRAPRLYEQLLRLRARGDSEERVSLDRFLATIAASRLLVVTGAGGVADHFRDYSHLTLLALRTARVRRIATAMMGHGFGPLTAPDLRAKAAAVLPGVDLIAVRERRASPPLLASLGVQADRVLTTGDDAIALAYEARMPEIGQAVGVNLRIARSSAVTAEDVPLVRAGIQRFIARQPAPLLGVPIARQHELDAKVIRELLRPERGAPQLAWSAVAGTAASGSGAAGPERTAHAAAAGQSASAARGAVATDSGQFALAPEIRQAAQAGAGIGAPGGAGAAATGAAASGAASAGAPAAGGPGVPGAPGAAGGVDDGRELDTPLAVIQRIGRCRIIVTGAYHAAVFALSQGIPAVCLARSPYFMDKFAGLADLFGHGCFLVPLDGPDLPARMADAMAQAWSEAPALRDPLREAAQRQIAGGEAAYAHLRWLVDGRRPGAS